MFVTASFVFGALYTAQLALAQSTQYGQCGGIGWTGPTTCPSGWSCITLNPYYFQCLPGTVTTTSTTSTTHTTSTAPRTTTTTTARTTTQTNTSRTTTTSTHSSSTTSRTSTTTSLHVTTGTGNNVEPTTLLPNQLWIRAVEDPNFHKYLQSSPPGSISDAILGDYTTAGQCNIVNGQLVQFTPAYTLYGIVEQPADSTVTKLKLSWGTGPNTFGTFAWQGDAVTWTAAGVSRQNTAAWLVCANQVAYINLGAYGYMTPAGCVDETIHYYNGATAVD